MSQLESALAVLDERDPKVAAYVREGFAALDEMVAHFMPKEGSGTDSRTIGACLVRAAYVLSDLPVKVTKAEVITDLNEIRRAVFGDIGDDPNIYADYDRAVDMQTKLVNAIAVLRLMN